MDRIHMIGYDAVHPSDFSYEVTEHHDYYLLILTQTPARFWQGETSKVYPAGCAALFAPDSRIHYGACEARYGNDWMIFCSDETFVTQFPLLATPFPVMDPEYCHNLFQLLTWEHMQDNYETTISQLMSVLFARLRADLGRNEGDAYGSGLLALRRQIFSHPREPWNVAQMAERLHISPGYLQALYKRRFGVSCIDAVIRSRIRLARDYLTHTNMRVSEIASLCGYNSTEHFSRQFRKQCGVAPGQFRAMASAGAGGAEPGESR